MSPQHMRIGYTCHHIIHTYWASHAQSAKKRAAELEVELSLEPANTVAEQVAAIGDFIAQEVAAVIIGPVNGTDPALASAAKEVLAAGIPVISTSTMIEGGAGKLRDRYGQPQRGRDRCRLPGRTVGWAREDSAC
jgi:ABC-type sugar transport system substrate-binding protein